MVGHWVSNGLTIKYISDFKGKKMTITEALAEIKTILKRLESKG